MKKILGILAAVLTLRLFNDELITMLFLCAAAILFVCRLLRGAPDLF